MAGSCIGVILLVMVLEALRRGAREYDAFIMRRFAMARGPGYGGVAGVSEDSDENNKTPRVRTLGTPPSSRKSTRFKPSLLQQVVRATMHMCQFAVAYFVRLLRSSCKKKMQSR